MEDIYTASRTQGISGQSVRDASAGHKGPAWSGVVLMAVLTALLLTACSAAPSVSDDKVNQESFSFGGA